MRHFSFQTPLLLKTVLVKYILLFHVLAKCIIVRRIEKSKGMYVCLTYQNSVCVVSVRILLVLQYHFQLGTRFNVSFFLSDILCPLKCWNTNHMRGARTGRQTKNADLKKCMSSCSLYLQSPSLSVCPSQQVCNRYPVMLLYLSNKKNLCVGLKQLEGAHSGMSCLPLQVQATLSTNK